MGGAYLCSGRACVNRYAGALYFNLPGKKQGLGTQLCFPKLFLSFRMNLLIFICVVVIFTTLKTQIEKCPRTLYLLLNIGVKPIGLSHENYLITFYERHIRQAE